MKIYKDLNVIVVKDKKLDSFKTYKVWFLIIFILSLSSITAFIFKNQINILSNLYFFKTVIKLNVPDIPSCSPLPLSLSRIINSLI